MSPLILHGEPSLVLGNESSRAAITPRGGHVRVEVISPSAEGWQSPYSLPPWTPSEFTDLPTLLQVLRGDFFCFPFGVTEGSRFPHGETANRTWTVDSSNLATATLHLDLEEMPGTVTKRVRYDPSNHALYQEHTVFGVSGVFNYGHHPILAVPSGQKGKFSTGPIRFGQVYPHGFADSTCGENATLQAGASFDALTRIATMTGDAISLAEYPPTARFEDLVMFVPVHAPIARNAFVTPSFVWLSLRRTSDFPSTLLWLSNGGRPQAPWHSRHTGRIGIEDVCSYFHEGAHRSRLDPLAKQRIPTARRFRPSKPDVFRHIQLVIPTSVEMTAVRAVALDESASKIGIEFEDHSVRSHPVDLRFLESGFVGGAKS